MHMNVERLLHGSYNWDLLQVTYSYASPIPSQQIRIMTYVHNCIPCIGVAV